MVGWFAAFCLVLCYVWFCGIVQLKVDVKLCSSESSLVWGAEIHTWQSKYMVMNLVNNSCCVHLKTVCLPLTSLTTSLNDFEVPWCFLSYILLGKLNMLEHFINTFKYHVSSIDGKISVKIKIEITFIFRLHRHPIQLVMFVPVGLSLKF